MTINAETISLIIGVASFMAAIIFFFAAKKSETNTIKLLAKLDERVESLKTINNSMLKTAIGHITTSNEHLIKILFLPGLTQLVQKK